MVQLRKREKINWLKGWLIRFVYSKQSCKDEIVVLLSKQMVEQRLHTVPYFN